MKNENMKLKDLYGNKTLFWDENSLYLRDMLQKELTHRIIKNLKTLNTNIQIEKIETPILNKYTDGKRAIENNMTLHKTDDLILRPELTPGSIRYFQDKFPLKNNCVKNLPYCVWQYGKSFRLEKNADSFRLSKLRLYEFTQLEFHIFCAPNTQAPYILSSLQALTTIWGGKIIKLSSEDLPYYSHATWDWEINNLEISSCSVRDDLDTSNIKLLELSFGIDRLFSQTTKVGNT